MYCKPTLSLILTFVTLATLPVNNAEAKTSSAMGEARLVAIYNTTIASETPGVVRNISVNPGAEVASHSTLVSLNEDIHRADHDVATAESEIAKLEARNRVNLEYAVKSTEVSAAVLEKSLQANRQYKSAIPETEVEKLRLEWEQSRLSGEQAEMEFEIAQWTETLKHKAEQAAKVRLDGREIRAPFDGTVAQVYIQPGQWVNAGDPIVRLIDSSRLRVEAYLHEDMFRDVKLGQSVYFEYTLAGEVSRVPAKVTFVGVEIVEGIFQVWAEFDNPEGTHVPGIEGQLVVGDLNVI